MATELGCTSLPPQEIGAVERREIIIGDTIILIMGGLHHQEGQAEGPIETETGKAIDRPAMVAEVEVEVHKGPDHHTLGDLLAKKLYWKGYRWIW